MRTGRSIGLGLEGRTSVLNFERISQEAERVRDEIDSCPLCGGHGSTAPDQDDIAPDTLEPRLVECQCYRRAVLQVKLIDGNVPLEFRREAPAAFKAFSAGPNASVAKLLREYARRLAAARKHGLGLFLYGENGVGKTLCASWLLGRAARAGFEVFYSTADEWLEAQKRAFRDEEFAEWLGQKADADFFVLDELGKEHRREDSTFAPAQFDRLLRSRASALMPTIVISNLLDSQRVEEVLGSSLTSILSGRRFKFVEFEPGDFRGAVSWEELLDDES